MSNATASRYADKWKTKQRPYKGLKELKSEIPPILFGDQQMSTVVKDFYRENSFSRDNQGNINLWKLYNLFIGANKAVILTAFWTGVSMPLIW